MTLPLVDTPSANKFRNNAKLPTWHKIWFGDTAKLPPEVHGFVKRASTALLIGIGKVDGLADDPTRTPVVRHATAKTVAAKAIAEILECKSQVEAFGHNMTNEASQTIDERFAINPNHSPIYERVINWINSKANLPDGPQKIREAMKQDPSIVTVLSNYPPYIFDLNEGICKNLVVDGYMHHMPEAADKMVAGQKLVETATNYDRAVKGVQGSFYNEGMALQAAKRVEA